MKIFDPIWHDDLAHALHDGMEEAGCCLTEVAELFDGYERTKETHQAIRASASCACCGDSRIVEMAHVVPRSVGGAITIPLCPTCHRLYDAGGLTGEEVRRIGRQLNALGIDGKLAKTWHGAVAELRGRQIVVAD